ncbi:hypothetical protein OIV83_001728 [Microbotryomycetes sp. JL201]|nr:hypothetical protein OIV83_001728 [Microbotryomycetes sp. JL201]
MADKSPGGLQSRPQGQRPPDAPVSTSARPSPRAPVISPELVDPADQRVWLFAAFVLVQAVKLSDLVSGVDYSASAASSVGDASSVGAFNATLVKWIAIDWLVIQCVSMLRVPRLDWGWRGLLTLRVAFAVLTPSMLLPTFIKSAVVTYLSTAEQSTKLAAVRGSDRSHLGGQYTVHILAVSTALLNPIPSTSYCVTSTAPEPVLIPFIVNNTSPTQLTYTLASLSDPSSSRRITVPVSELQKPARHANAHASPRDSDDEGLPSWAVVPAASSSAAPRHQLPSAARESSDPFNLSPTETLYYLSVDKPGAIRLESVTDHEGNPVRIRRRRASAPTPGRPSTDADATVYPCPRAGFRLDQHEQESHMCVANGLTGSVSLELAVSGQEPLTVKWHSREGEHGPSRQSGLDAIALGPAATVDSVVDVPFNVSLTRPGRTTFTLDRVIDGAGNDVKFVKDSTRAHVGSKEFKLGALVHHAVHARTPDVLVNGAVATRSFVVHRPPEVAFAGQCGRGQDVKLLHRSKATLEMRLTGIEQDLRASGQQSWTITVKYSPEASSGKSWVRTVVTSSQTARMTVEEAGTYEIIKVQGQWCDGLVLVPNLCNVVLQPQPTLASSFEPLYDVCKSEVGAIAALHLNGVPPFVVNYDLIQHTPNGPRRSARRKTISSLRDEIRLEPGPGDWEYKFTSIDDHFYKDVRLPGDKQYSLRQTVQLVSDAQWRNARQRRVIHACEGETFTAEVELKGAGPWTLEYSILGHPKQVISGIKSSPFAIDVTIPQPIADRGGVFSLSLESIRDGHGCTRPLTTAADLVVEVQRTKPTAKFHGLDGSRTAVIKDKGTAKIPLRLTGNGPWTITYQPPPLEGSHNLPAAQQFVAREQNVNLEIANARPGVYRLVSVRDEFCPGQVLETDWKVETLPRPSLRVDKDVGKLAKNGSLVRSAVCQDALDQVGFTFQGQAPFHAIYTLSKDGKNPERHTLSSISSHTTLPLFTASAGHHVYDFVGVGDSLYTGVDNSGLIAPDGGRAGVMRLEHHVLGLPIAEFAPLASQSSRAAPAFCVSDTLSRTSTRDDMVVKLQGSPPFQLDVQVRESGQRHGRTFHVTDIKTNEWHVDLPYELQLPVPHVITLVKVRDSNGCVRVLDSTAASGSPLSADAKTTMTIQVAEIASIAAVSNNVDVCVGDFLEFVVQGSPPFTVKYEFNGKQHTVPLQSSKFSRLAAEPGKFKILTVGHGQDQCRSNNVNLIKHVHPIPTASVSTGDSFIVDIREGEQTEIVFGFKGTPPFSFTYSRRKPQDRYKDKTVLETHTVTGITDYTYSIMTSQEGTWSVSYIADRYCSYPASSTASAAGSSGGLLHNLQHEAVGANVKRAAVTRGDGSDGTAGVGIGGWLQRVKGVGKTSPIAEGIVVKS